MKYEGYYSQTAICFANCSRYGLEYPSGCIIAKVNLSDCIKVDDEFRKMLYEENTYIYSSIIKHKEWDGYGFKIENVKKIEPISVKGKLNLWEYDYESNAL